MHARSWLAAIITGEDSNTFSERMGAARWLTDWRLRSLTDLVNKVEFNCHEKSGVDKGQSI